MTNNKNSKRPKMLQHKRLPTETGGLAYLVKVLATKHGSLSSIPHGGRRELILHAVLWHAQVFQGTQVCTWVHANISNSITTIITFQNSKVPKGSHHMQREKQKAKQIVNLHKIKYSSNGICQTSLQCHWQGDEPGSPRCLNSHENIKLTDNWHDFVVALATSQVRSIQGNRQSGKSQPKMFRNVIICLYVLHPTPSTEWSGQEGTIQFLLPREGRKE